MRVLVTGATGGIGSALCDALLARGDEVAGLTRDPAKAKPANPTVTWFAWQPATERPPPEAFDQVDAVVNLVGEEINQRLTEEAKARIRDSRVTSAKNLIDAIAALDARPSVFIAQSAIGYYGDRGAKMLDEESRPGEGFGAELPVEWEATQREAEKHVGRLAILRTGLVLDKDHGLLKQLLPPFKLGVGGPLAGGDQYMSWIHLDDEVGLILWALDTEAATGVINATAPNPVTNTEFSKALGAAVNRPAFMPAPKLAVVALRGRELAEMVTGSTRVMPRRALDLGYAFRFPDVGPAIEDAVKA
ncbi:MAG: TIGR01777 family protein [Solirubrobacterales bacterium]|nr:TIGR01777 family protein [Solirubrobacterales bacterium]